MKIHTVRQPFLCREGQFTPFKRELCVGIDYNTLVRNPNFRCYLGKNKKTVYDITATIALEKGHQWVNPKGKTVIIVPLSVFEIKQSTYDPVQEQLRAMERDQINSRILNRE